MEGKEREITFISSKAGPALMMFMEYAIGYNTKEKLEKLNNRINEANPAPWYIWCRDNHFQINNPNPNDGWIYLARCFGMCYDRF